MQLLVKRMIAAARSRSPRVTGRTSTISGERMGSGSCKRGLATRCRRVARAVAAVGDGATRRRMCAKPWLGIGGTSSESSSRAERRLEAAGADDSFIDENCKAVKKVHLKMMPVE